MNQVVVILIEEILDLIQRRGQTPHQTMIGRAENNLSHGLIIQSWIDYSNKFLKDSNELEILCLGQKLVRVSSFSINYQECKLYYAKGADQLLFPHKS